MSERTTQNEQKSIFAEFNFGSAVCGIEKLLVKLSVKKQNNWP
jgi:hypothetical protein